MNEGDIIKIAIISYGSLERNYHEEPKMVYETIEIQEYTEDKFIEFYDEVKKEEEFHITFFKTFIVDRYR